MHSIVIVGREYSYKHNENFIANNINGNFSDARKLMKDKTNRSFAFVDFIGYSDSEIHESFMDLLTTKHHIGLVGNIRDLETHAFSFYGDSIDEAMVEFSRHLFELEFGNNYFKEIYAKYNIPESMSLLELSMGKHSDYKLQFDLISAAFDVALYSKSPIIGMPQLPQ